MRIEVNRAWALVETRKWIATIIWPGSRAAEVFTDADDRCLGWTTMGDGETQPVETRFSLGRVFATLERKLKGPLMQATEVEAETAAGALKAA